MADEFSLLLLGSEAAARELRACGEITARYGLWLSEEQILELTSLRLKALQDTGRVEFGTGALSSLALAFCDSPFIDEDSYAATLAELLELFYGFKNEYRSLSDDELIAKMKRCFDGVCQGAAEYLPDAMAETLGGVL